MVARAGFVVGPVGGRVSGLSKTAALVRHAPMRAARAVVRASLTVEQVGEKDTFDFRLFFSSEAGDKVSPWADVALYANDDKTLVNFVNEIPRGTTAKMEIATDEDLHPIKQDIKKGALRHYKYGPSLINYGALPQTWEDPEEVHPDTGLGGDNDPVDLVEIGSQTTEMGSVYPVKPFGVLALLDEGETDWKVLAINASDPKAKLVNSVDDANVHFPGVVDEVREWFRNYKTAEGKGVNEYAFDGEAKNTAYAMKVIADTNESWKKLQSGDRSL